MQMKRDCDEQLPCHIQTLTSLIELTNLSIPLYRITKFTLPSLHSQDISFTLPRQHCEIVKSFSPCGVPKRTLNCSQIIKKLGCPMLEFFLLKLLPMSFINFP